MNLFSHKGVFLGDFSPETLLEAYFPVNEKAAEIVELLGPNGKLMLEYQRILRMMESNKYAGTLVRPYSHIDWLEDFYSCIQSGQKLPEQHPLFPLCQKAMDEPCETVNPSLELKNLHEAARASIKDSVTLWLQGFASTSSFRRLRKLYGQIKGILGGDEEFQEYQRAYLHYLRYTQESDCLAYEMAKVTIDFLDKTLENFWKQANPDAG